MITREVSQGFFVQQIDPEDIQRLKTYRGKAWVKVFRKIDECELIEDLRTHLSIQKELNGGKLSVREVALAYHEFGLHGIAGKTYFRFLEGPVLKKGTYDRLIDRGMKWTGMVELAVNNSQVGQS